MDNERVKESVSVGNEAMTTRQDKKKQGRGKTAAGGRILLHIFLFHILQTIYPQFPEMSLLSTSLITDKEQVLKSVTNSLHFFFKPHSYL